MKFFFFRNFGWFLAATLAILWYFVPQAAVVVLDGNIWVAGLAAKAAGLVFPALGEVLGSFLALVKAMGAGVKAIAGLLPFEAGPRFEATVRIIAEALLLLGEIKIARGLWWIGFRSWRTISWPWRRRNAVNIVQFRHRNAA